MRFPVEDYFNGYLFVLSFNDDNGVEKYSINNKRKRGFKHISCYLGKNKKRAIQTQSLSFILDTTKLLHS